MKSNYFDPICGFENSASALLSLLIQKSADPDAFWAKILFYFIQNIV
jgi:hypothetical protein